MLAALPDSDGAAFEDAERTALRLQDGDPDAAIDAVLFENITDTGNAHRFAMQHGERLRYADTLGGWHYNPGDRWRRDDTGEVFRCGEQTVRSIYQEAALAGDPKQRTDLAGWARKSEGRARLEAMIASARHQPQIVVRAADFDADPWAFNVLNGTIDLQTVELRPHRRTDLITKLAPVAFDPSATAPCFLAMLERIFNGRRALITFVQRFVGYSLTGLTQEQILLLLYGVGANGKSTFVEILRALHGDYAQTADFGTFLARDQAGARNDLARLVGARLVSAVEMSRGGRLDEAVVKQLTGGDMITARFLFREHFEFRPAFKLVLVSNHKPRISGTDYAIWRRVRLIPFETIIPEGERDGGLLERITKTELSGVLNWALEGCRQWQAEGLGAPAEVVDATDEYRQEQDTLAPFLAEHCVVADTASTKAGALYVAYKAWADAAGERAVAQRTLGEWLKERGFQSKHTKTGTVWLGVGVRGDG